MVATYYVQYIAVNTQCSGSWADFFEAADVVKGTENPFFLAKETSRADFVSLSPSTLGLQYRLCPMAYDTAIALGGGHSFYSCTVP